MIDLFGCTPPCVAGLQAQERAYEARYGNLLTSPATLIDWITQYPMAALTAFFLCLACLHMLFRAVEAYLALENRQTAVTNIGILKFFGAAVSFGLCVNVGPRMIALFVH